MTAPQGVRIDGAENLERTLKAFGDGLSDLTAPLATIARKGLQDARRRAPVFSGRLSSSGFAQGTPTAAVIGFSARHAGPLNFGVGPRVGLRGPHNIRARNFMSAAVDVEFAVDTLTAEVDARLGKVKGA